MGNRERHIACGPNKTISTMPIWSVTTQRSHLTFRSPLRPTDHDGGLNLAMPSAPKASDTLFIFV